MADVFISYHRSESASALVRRIAEKLDSMGISCWYDTKDPKPGFFASEITKEIEQCKVFILLWDKGANKSKYCLSETNYAFTYASALIVPFQVGTFERDRKLSLYTGAFQIIFDTDELIKKIAAEFGKTSVSAPPDPPFVTLQQLSPMKIIKHGKCGDNVTYELNASGVLTISGAGPMWDFEWDSENKRYDVPWWEERETISRARILKGVTSIGDWAFFGCASLASVDIPDRVTSIGEGAFWNCASLASVDIPDSVTEIGDYAFWNCENLKSVSVPAEADIGDAFDDTTEVIRRPRK